MAAAPAAGPTISGSVRDERGRSVAGATVCVSPADGADPRPARCSRTDLAGRYRQPLASADPVRVDASAAGFSPRRCTDPTAAETTTDGESRTAMDITLQRGGVQVIGDVTDITGGPVEGAVVTVVGATQSGPRGHGVSDDEGHFVVWADGSERAVEVTARASGYTPARAFGLATNFTFSLVAMPESIVSGSVQQADGQPAPAGVVVRASPEGFGGQSAHAITDRRGMFEVGGMTAGRYALSAVGPGLRGDADRTVGVGFAEHVDGVRIMTHPGIDIQGLVTLEGSQQGCPTGFVQLSDGTSGTVTKGTVSLRAATAGVHKVTVRCEGMLALPEYEPLVVAAPPAEPPSPRWSVTRGATITGMFVDSRGDPVAKVAVHAGPTDEIEDALASGSTTSDTEGRFAINGLQEGTHRLLIEAEGYASLADRPKATAVGEGSSPVALRIVLPDGGELAGRVVGDDQAPIAGVGVVANDGSSILSTTSTDDDGNFSFTGLRLGPLRVTLNEGWDELEEPITVDADLSVNPSAPIVIEIPARSHRITGTVVDEEQSPVADAFVRAVPAAVASGL